MGILMSGQIYIKRGPEPYKMEDWEKDMIDKTIGALDNGEFEEFFEEMNGEPLDLSLVEAMKDVLSTELNKEGKLDYSGCTDFWICTITDGIFMKNGDGKYIKLEVINKYGERITKECTVKELGDNFISLTSFLEQAEYIGKKFKRTKPLDGDFAYVHDEFSIPEVDDVLALYKLDNLLLVYSRDGFNKKDYEYEILDTRYLEDGNYKFYGKENKEFKDKKTEIYQGIFNQMHKHKVKKYKR